MWIKAIVYGAGGPADPAVEVPAVIDHSAVIGAFAETRYGTDEPTGWTVVTLHGGLSYMVDVPYVRFVREFLNVTDEREIADEPEHWLDVMRGRS